MAVAVLVVFALFFTGLVVLTTTPGGRLRAAVRRPRLFQFAAVGAAAATVPVDLYAVVHGTVGPDGAALSQVADRLLLLNVAASCGVAALHELLRVPTFHTAGKDEESTEQPLRMGVLGWTGPLIALVVITAVVAVGSDGNGSGFGAVGSVWAAYSLLLCVISAYALLRRRAVPEAIGPPEG